MSGIDNPVTASQSGGRVWLVWPLLMLALAALFVSGWLPRARRAESLAAATAESTAAKPRVRVATPKAAPAGGETRLPGSVEAAREATIYARSSGYVRLWSADLGDRVTQGQVLVELDAPEMAHLLAEGEATVARDRATVEQVKANLVLAKVQLERAKSLGAGVTSQQDIDVRQGANDVELANLAAAEAVVRASEANFRRLQQLKAFSQVIAPYAGTIAMRGIDVGDLVTAGTGAGAKPLYRLIQTDPVKVVVDVPQHVATTVTTGLATRVITRNGPAVAGTVARIAHALDPASRTMRIEIEAPNSDGRLLPGMYVQVALTVPERMPLMMINANALIVGAGGIQVATLDAGDRVTLRSIVIELDTGTEIGVATGLTAADRVVLNPPVGLVDGVALEVLPLPPAKP